MKQIALLMLAFGSPVLAAPQPTPEQQVRHLYQRITKAVEQGNVATIRHHIAEDFIFVESMGGAIKTKTEFLRVAAEANRKYYSGDKLLDRRISSVKVQGQIAGVVEIYNMKDGKWYRRTTITAIFVKKKQHWQLLAATASSCAD